MLRPYKRTFRAIILAVALASLVATTVVLYVRRGDPENAVVAALIDRDYRRLDYLLSTYSSLKADQSLRRRLLHVTVDSCDISSLRVLLAHGFNPNEGHESLSPLSICLMGRDVETARVLLEAGADPRLTKFDALDYVITEGFPELIEPLVCAGVDVLKRNGGLTYLHFACGSYYVSDAVCQETIFRLSKFIDVDSLSGSGDTPLQDAASRNDIAVAESLILSGADPNYTSEPGKAPLTVAMSPGSPKDMARKRRFIEMLLYYGAEVDDSALDAAKGLGEEGLVDLLADRYNRNWL